MKTIGTFMKVAIAIFCMVSFTSVYAGPPTWVRVDYTNTTAFVGEVQINAYDAGFPITVEAGDYIGAFVGGECRMIAQIFTYNGKLYVSSVIHGGDIFDGFPSNDPAITNSQELIEFRVWDNSATAQVNRTVKGTLKATPGGEVLDYIIGKPNTDSQLTTLSVTGITLVPAFSAAQTTYTVSMPAGSTLPALAAYTATVADSRATVTVTPATNFTTGNATTIVVTAEDGTTTTYTITYSEQPCTVLAPTVTTPVEYCQGATATALTATGTNLKWYTVSSGGTALAGAPTPSTATVGNTTYYVSQTTTCESPRASIVVTIKALPATPIAGSNSPICASSTLNLTASTIAGATYAWSGPSSFVNATQNPSRTNATPAMAGTYSVTATANGCTSAAGTVTVVINDIPAAPTAGSNSPICAGSTLNLTASTIAGATYAWSGPSSFTNTTQNPSRTNITTAMAGTYSVTATVNGCTSPAGTVAVVVNTAPAAPTAGSNGPICEGATLNLTASTIAGATYAWSGPSSFTNTSQNPTRANATTLMSGTYSVTATANGCTSPAGTVDVVVNAIPTAPTAGSNSPICAGSTLNLTASTIAGATYAWSGPSSFANTTQNPTRANATTLMSGTYSVTATANGCTSPAGTVSVLVNATPVTPVAATPISVIVGDASPNLTATVTDGGTITWYNAANTEIGTGSPLASGVSTATEGNYSFSVSNKIGTCESVKVPVTVTVSNCNVAAPTVTSTIEYCQGATASALTATGSNLKWYTTSTGGTASTIAPIPSTATVGVTTYYVSQTTTCESPRAAIVVTIKAVPSAPIAGSNSPVCQGETINLTASAITGATYTWTGNLYSNATQNPSIANATPNNAGTYTVTATVNGCTSTAATTMVVVQATPVTPVAITPISVIVGDASPNLTATVTDGGTITWYNAANTQIGTGSPLASGVSTASEGNYSFSVSNKIGTCESVKVPVSITVSNCNVPTPTVTSAIEYCQGATASALTATGSNLKWYTTSTGGTASTIAPIPSTATVGVTTYYVSQTTTCESPRAAIVVTIKATPSAPIAGSNSPVCQGETINLTASTIAGATYAWTGNLYSNATQNPSIANATPNNAGTYTVTATVNGCTSTAATTTVVVNSTPVTPVAATPISVIVGDASPNLTATVTDGGTITWYNAANTEIGTGSPLASGISTASEGNYSFSVSNKIGTCESVKVPVSVTVSNCNVPAPTVTSAIEYCQGATASMLTATGTGLSWYTSATGGTASTIAPIPSTANVGVTTYYVSQTTTCESPRAAIVVTIKALPSAPIAGSNSPVCQGENINLTASTITGATYAWTGNLYSNATQNPSIVNATPNNAGTYTVTATVNGCTSTAATVTVAVNSIPTAPVVENVSILDGQTVPNLTAQGTGLTWYDNVQLQNGVQTQSYPTGKTLPGVYTYYVTQKVANCESPASEITLTIACAVSAPTLVKTQESVCQGSSYTFTAIITSGNFAVWTNEQGTVIGNSATYTTSTAGTYYVKQQNASATCISETSAASLFVKPLPTAPITTNVSVCEGNQGSLTIGKSAKWYQNQTDVTALYSGLTFTPNVTTSGVYNYYVSEVSNGCEGPKSLVTYTIESNPSITVNDVIVPLGSTVPDLTVVTAAQNTVNWYETNKVTFIKSGTSYATGKTTLGVYTYYVEAVSPLQCVSAKTAITLQISDCNLAAPTVSATNTNICAGSASPTLQALASESVRWYSDAALTQIASNSAQFIPADSEPGTYTYYAVQYAACVSPAKSISFTIHALPNPQIFAASTAKVTDAPIAITVSPLGGSLLGTGLQGTSFVPSSVTPGFYNIQYSYTDANQCTKSVVHTIEVIQVESVDRTQLGDTILRANAIFAQYSENPLYTSTAKLELQNAITIAEFYYNNYLDYSNAVMLEQTLALSQAIKTFLQSYNPVTIDLAVLEAKIAQANNVYNINISNVGTNPGQYPASSFIALQNEINNAQNKVDNPPATQLEVDNAVIVLDNAIKAFIDSQIPVPAVESISTTPTLVKMVIDETYTPQVIFAPLGSTGTIQWVSSNTSIATVIAGTGTITAKGKGTASITGTLMEDPSKTVTVVVQVSGTPALVSTSMNNLGNKITLEFSEPMAEPSASIYTDIQVTGVSPYFYTVTNVERDPNNINAIVLSLGSVIDNPAQVSIIYSGSSLQSEAGAQVQSFNTKLTVDIDVVDVNIMVYPTIATSQVTLVGVAQADLIQVISTNGQVVLTQSVTGDIQEIDVTSLAQGTYSILVIANNSILIKATCIKK